MPERPLSSSIRRLALVAILALSPAFVPPPAARADNGGGAPALINEALDKPIADLQVSRALPEAMKEIQAKTGVQLKADPTIWDMLPWGEQTNVTVKVQNQTLRQALTAVTQKLGLTFAVGDDAVILRPLPPLRRMPRRATVQELQAMDVLASGVAPEAAVGDRTAQAVAAAVDAQLDKSGSPYAVENRLSPEMRSAAVTVPRNATMLDALEEVAKQTKATWYPWGKNLVLVSKETQVRDELSLRTFTARYAGTDIGQVLDDLRRRSGVEFTIEPQALQKIPPEFRTVRVFWDNVSISQALESLRGFTGLDYTVTDQGLTITNPAPALGAGGGGVAIVNADPVIGQIAMGNGMVLFVRDSQVPADLKPYFRKRVQQTMDDMRQAAGLPTPAPKPESQPAAPAPPAALPAGRPAPTP